MNKSYPVVSIIVPVYNGENVLKRCIESILCQTFKDWELLLIEDGSQDKSQVICESYEKQDDRIRLISKENEGVSATRNRGIKEAKGQYIQFVDCDDYLMDTYLEVMVSKMIEQKVDLVITGYTRHKAGKIVENLPREMKISGKKELAQNFFGLYNHWYLNTPWNKLYCRDNIKDIFPEDMSLGEDLLFNLSYLKNVGSIYVIKDGGYQYCIENEQSLGTRFRKDKFENSCYLHSKILDFAKEYLEMEQEETWVDETFLKEIRFAVTNLVRTNELTSKEKKQKIQEWTAREEVKSAYQRCKNLGKQDEIFRFFILKEWNVFLYYIVKCL
ncbi:MAG: glycosyltransferase [Lachnospiraceae bacterium]|nr:glycosyltransferase [Lachnospiraceae bacterium]